MSIEIEILPDFLTTDKKIIHSLPASNKKVLTTFNYGKFNNNQNYITYFKYHEYKKETMFKKIMWNIN